jgi:hypothetical protein
LVRMDRHGRAWRSRDRLYSRAVARALVSPILAGMGMGGADPLDDRVRLPDYPLVPTIGKNFAPIVLFSIRGSASVDAPKGDLDHPECVRLDGRPGRRVAARSP